MTTRLPLGISPANLAAAIDMPLAVLEQLLQGRRQVDAELDRKLGQALGTSAGYWLRAQELADQLLATSTYGRQQATALGS